MVAKCTPKFTVTSTEYPLYSSVGGLHLNLAVPALPHSEAGMWLAKFVGYCVINPVHFIVQLVHRIY